MTGLTAGQLTELAARVEGLPAVQQRTEAGER